MKYSMCFFPLVGAVIGLFSLMAFAVMEKIHAGKILAAAVMASLPVLLTGGIHFDGFLDTVDAKSSYRPKEEKLRILKDPHTGAFAIIYGIVFFLLSFGLFSQIHFKTVPFISLGYIYSRILSGLSVTILKKAKKEGMAASSAEAAGKSVKWILLAELAFCITGRSRLFFTLQKYGILCVWWDYW